MGWTSQVFLVLFLNMALELLREQVLDVIDPSKNETPLVDAEAESSDDESGDEEEGEEGEGEEEEAKEVQENGKEEEESDDNEEDEDEEDAMDEEESGIDKLRMQLHEVLKKNGGVEEAETDA